MKIQQNFKRYEKKYLINKTQYRALRERLADYMAVDQYGWNTICNIYYDTPDYRLIRASIEKPMYKEKLRLRTYGVPTDDSSAYVEVKKKFKGIVYKRRMVLPYAQAFQWLNKEPVPMKESQIEEEILWFRKFYHSLEPRIVLCYDRLALYGLADKEFRVTFDHRIRWRRERLDLTAGDDGELLLPDDNYIMEIKIHGAMPLWMADLLDELDVYPTSFSKYGKIYQSYMC